MPTVSETIHEAPVERGSSTPREFDILDVLVIIAARKRLIFLTSVAGFVLAIGLVLLVKPSFTAKTMILPPEQEQSSGAVLMGQFGALASMTGLGGSLGLKNPVDLYIGILQSETVIDRMIKRFDLMAFYHAKRLSDVRAALKNSSKFVADKDGMIAISVTDHDPKRAAAMANAYVQELYQVNNRLALGGASQRRLFYEQQLTGGERQACRC